MNKANLFFAFIAGLCALTFIHKGDPIAGFCALFLIVYLFFGRNTQ